MRLSLCQCVLGVGLGSLLFAAGCPVERATGSHSVGADASLATPGPMAPGSVGPMGASTPPATRRRAEARPQPSPAPDASAPAAPQVAPDAAAPAPDAAVATPPTPAPAQPEDPTNQVRPQDELRWLQTQGRALLAAMAAGEAKAGEGFFFPRAPFAKLKQAGNPDAYWQHLMRLYAEDLARLKRRHADWTSATFESLALQGPPQWVAPGEEHNRIGYYRARYARLRYRHSGQRYSVFVHTLITWQGRWYVTHLAAPRPRGALRRAPARPR